MILFHIAKNIIIGEKDPHFLIQSSVAQNTDLCFDVDGKDGDVLQLIQDPDHSK